MRFARVGATQEIPSSQRCLAGEESEGHVTDDSAVRETDAPQGVLQVAFVSQITNDDRNQSA
ncbi:MAG: hypothetical protein WCB68_02065 [Pyrinomonadaceae bacterium]